MREAQVHNGGHGEGRVLIRRPPGSCLKYWLGHYWGPGASNKDCEAGGATRWAHCSWTRLLVVSFVLLAMTAMALLLFWNYQCIFVERLCQGQEESSVFPVFGDPEERTSTEEQG